MTLDRLLASPDDASTSALPAVIRWSAPGLTLKFAHGDGPVRLIRATTTGVDVHIPGSIPATDVIAAGHGRTLVGSRLVQSRLGASLRLAAVLPTRDGGLDLVSDSPDGLRITLHLRTAGQAAFTATTTIENTGDTVIDLHAVTSWASALGSRADTGHGVADWDLLQGRSDWLGEGRWSTSQLRSVLPSLNQAMTGHTPRSANRRSSQGTWSTGGSMPLGGAVSTARGITWLWQVENNGPWRWEIGEHVDDVFIALAGPTDIDHQWQQPLAPGESFTTVPATIALGADLDSAAAALTRHRRLTRRPHPDNTRPAIVFNDYMNTLNGDPTTQKLLPLVDAAAAVGAEVFCIDAGWYDDGGDWWPSVGAWQPSNVRFSGGLAEVTDRIRSHGMVPGLWLEPESVGVLSPIASSLPPEAFLQRAGQRILEQDRLHLDLRHPAARAHLDEVVDRLVQDFGVGYFKLDYNTDPGAGTDVDSPSPGAGLLGHSRAVLDWLDGVLDRHPDLILEACSSGAMRADQAILSRVQAQSTSDQQDYLLYPPIAAAAPLSMLPEQAASWAYPQSSMTDEQSAFCLVTSLLGRFFLSGYLNTMDDTQMALVREAVTAAHEIRGDLVRSAPSWPSGLPAWEDRFVSVALVTEARFLVSVWDRGEPSDEHTLEFPSLRGTDVDIDVVFPQHLTPWQASWNAATGTLTVRSTADTVGARTFALTPLAS
ncbi:alpha-galactosidase (plasmid) [Clavibacter capsici]|uniref:Alpha-galactosidase n=2 Tax=Clavibacter capsici TaxID=1874630 RepID=A0AAE6XTE9_9MICO|nr:glycoside hydrolase family 36 protein [Clavibacter capsici]QIS43536.1 alpha-galactosidase [Clavibacter capsici]QIS46419.1 alpha-galactosidase [Clavibacter capsici]